MASAIRVLAMDAVEAAKSGHPGMPMGMADVATELYENFLKFDPADPDWMDRDRVVLSAGHGSMLLYALLYLTGYEGVQLADLKAFRKLGSKTAGHPEYGHCPGVETTTGPLGQGIATAVGMALAERMLNARFGNDIVDHYTYVMAGDGCLMEGLSHEAIDLAGHLRLNRLIVLFDDNAITIDGSTSLSTSVDQCRRFEASGWNTTRINGHDRAEIHAAIRNARTSDRPTLIACRTVIGFGAPNKQGGHDVHGSPLGAGEIAAARAYLEWPSEPFEVPTDVLAQWRATAARGKTARAAWRSRLEALDEVRKQQFLRATQTRPDASVCEKIESWKRELGAAHPSLATRVASQKVLERLAEIEPRLVGGSADLTGSNGTRVKLHTSVAAGNYSGNYINYGIREHGMAAAMNGMALHGGFIPYGGTFLAFADYCRPSIRLSALMGVQVVYVMTHDSIGLGEDGPTHQPVEHLASLRAIPNVNVIRPADIVETTEAWAMALRSASTPTVLCLTRQNLPLLRTEHTNDNLVALGGYVLRETDRPCDVTLMATGSEAAIAVDAATQLAARGVAARVVSMPCWELFEKTPRDYREGVLGTAPRIAIEAAIRLGWDRWLRPGDTFIGMPGFGASAPAADLYKHFGITAAAIVAAALQLTQRETA
jgi:transketolase